MIKIKSCIIEIFSSAFCHGENLLRYVICEAQDNFKVKITVLKIKVLIFHFTMKMPKACPWWAPFWCCRITKDLHKGCVTCCYIYSKLEEIFWTYRIENILSFQSRQRRILLDKAQWWMNKLHWSKLSLNKTSKKKGLLPLNGIKK